MEFPHGLGLFRGLYILVGQTAVPCEDPLDWFKWKSTADVQVALAKVGKYRVSTVFLGKDLRLFRNERGAPLLFETASFEGEEIRILWRCSTWLEAEAQHKHICEELAKEHGDAIEEIPWREALPEPPA